MSFSIYNKRTLSGQGQEEAGLVLMDWERPKQWLPAGSQVVLGEAACGVWLFWWQRGWI